MCNKIEACFKGVGRGSLITIIQLLAASYEKRVKVNSRLEEVLFLGVLFFFAVAMKTDRNKNKSFGKVNKVCIESAAVGTWTVRTCTNAEEKNITT